MALSLLLAQLWHIQVAQNRALATGAVRQRARATPLGPARGDIVDRNGQSLTGAHAGTVSLRSGGHLSLAVPTKTRNGPDALAHHLIGYVRADDNRGVSGVELAMDRYLRSDRAPQALAFVDGKGQPMSELGIRSVAASSQNEVWLTIDRGAQTAAEKALDRAGASGAAVVLDAASGEVVAMVSRPDFAPDRVEDSLTTAGGPLVNRALAGYAPGSVFKLVVLAAALEVGATHAGETFVCPGYVEVGQQRIPCLAHQGGPPVKLTVVDALAQSCNTVFVQLGLRIGPEAIARQARLFGLGRATGSGLPGEAEGNVPSGRMNSGDVANMALGQGEVMVTPLQVTRLVAAIAGRGIDRDVKVFDRVVNQDGITLWRSTVPTLTRPISAATASVLVEAMTRAVKTGTSRAAQPAPTQGRDRAAGKSGTAETPRKTADGRAVNNAWFAGFYPAGHPKWIIVVVLETTGTGGGQAGPVFAQIADGLARSVR